MSDEGKVIVVNDMPDIHRKMILALSENTPHAGIEGVNKLIGDMMKMPADIAPNQHPFRQLFKHRKQHWE